MLAQVDFPVIVVQFKNDYFCNQVVYPAWYANLQLAMEHPPSPGVPGRRRELFFFFDIEGTHDTAEQLLETLVCSNTGDMLLNLWHAM